MSISLYVTELKGKSPRAAGSLEEEEEEEEEDIRKKSKNAYKKRKN